MSHPTEVQTIFRQCYVCQKDAVYFSQKQCKYYCGEHWEAADNSSVPLDSRNDCVVCTNPYTTEHDGKRYCKMHESTIKISTNGDGIFKQKCPSCGTLFKMGERHGCFDQEKINHPSHYTSHPSGIEAITICEHMGFNIGNAMKYLFRAPYKGNLLEDLEKAKWYISREIEKAGKTKKEE